MMNRGFPVAVLFAIAVGHVSSATVRAEDSEHKLTLNPYANPRVLLLDAAASQGAPPAPALPRLVPVVDYSGDSWGRPALTGDWGGLRQQAMEKGLRVDLSVTQIYQRNWAGGKENRGTYQGSMDLSIRLDTTYAGLWPGGLFSLRAEGRWGQSNNRDTGSLLPGNNDSIFPAGEKNVLALPEFNYTQFLAPFVGVTLGKYAPRDANVFAHSSDDQFLNTAFNFNPVIDTTVPLSFLGAGFIILPFSELMITTLAFDTEGRGDTTGFNTAFKGGTSIMQLYDLTIKPFGFSGHQRVGWTWTDKVRTILDQNPRDILSSILKGDTSGLERKSGDWAAFYDFDQYIYMVPGSEDRGLGVFGRVGYSEGTVNPVEQFYSLGIGGKGLIPGRDNDSFGIAYYYLKISDSLPQTIQKRTRDEQGMECYYNIAVTRWLHISPDLQIIRPANGSIDTTFVAGIRLKVDF